MERKTTSTGEFEEAIKNFSKVSLEVDSLINAGNVDAHKLLNKSIEHRNQAIANEATKRLKSFEMEQKDTKSTEALKSDDTMEQLFMDEVEMEFDKGVEEQKIRLRGDSTIVSKDVENKKSEDSEDNSDEEDESDEDTADTETTDKDSSEGDDEDSSESEESDDDESAEDEVEA